jgi:hypothetical protein
MATRGAGQGPLLTRDRALIEMQREIESLKLQLSERSTSKTRQLHRGDNRGGFARTARGLDQVPHELNTEDFRPALSRAHVLIEAVQALEVTEAYWYPLEDWISDPVNYSFIELRTMNGNSKRLGYISGQPLSTVPGATGDLKGGGRYRFHLEANPRAKAGETVEIFSEASTNPGVWPDGTVTVCWRWL